MVGHRKVVGKKSETPVGPCRPPLLHFIARSSQHANQRHKHIPIQRIPDESYAGVPVALEETKGIDTRKVAAGGLPSPAEQIGAVGFVVGDAIPALKDLLAGLVVPGDDGVRVPDPGAVVVVARLAPQSLGGIVKAVE